MAKGPVGNFECALQNALKLFRSIPSLKNEQKECLQQLVVERRDEQFYQLVLGKVSSTN